MQIDRVMEKYARKRRGIDQKVGHEVPTSEDQTITYIKSEIPGGSPGRSQKVIIGK